MSDQIKELKELWGESLNTNAQLISSDDIIDLHNLAQYAIAFERIFGEKPRLAFFSGEARKIFEKKVQTYLNTKKGRR